MRQCNAWIEIMRLFTIVILVAVSIMFFRMSEEMKREALMLNGSENISNLVPVEGSSNIRHSRSVFGPISREVETSRRLKRHKLSHKSNPRKGSRQKQHMTPEAKLHELTTSIFRNVASYRIPTGWILPFCFKKTHLRAEIDKTSDVCERMGIDWSCVFSELAGGDEGFDLLLLEKKFDSVEDALLKRGLKSAIVACREYWEKYKSEERRRLLLHEVELEVLRRTWKEHGKVIESHARRKRDTKVSKHEYDIDYDTNPADLRLALIKAGLAGFDADSDDAGEMISDSSKNQTHTADYDKFLNSTRPKILSNNKNAEMNQIHHGSSSQGLYERARSIKTSDVSRRYNQQFVCSAGNIRCRRQNIVDYDAIREQRARKKEEILKKQTGREKQRRRMEELLSKVGGDNEIFNEPTTEDPEEWSKLGLHLEREERIEEDLREQVSSCITEETAKACEPKVMRAISEIMKMTDNTSIKEC